MLLRALTGQQTRETVSLPGRVPWAQPLTGPIRVGDVEALTLPVANRCVQIISDSIGRLPLHAYRNDRQIDTPPLLETPEPGFTRMETMAAMVTSLLLHGNAYGLVADRDYLGHPTSVVLLAPTAVSVRQSQTGMVTYRVAGREYSAEEMLHIRGMSLPGSVTGVGVVEMHRRSIAAAISAEDYAGELFSTGAIPDGVLQTAQDLSPTEATDLKNAFVRAHGGRQRTPAVLSGGVTYEPIAWSNVDLEALESRKWNAVTICQMFGVPTIFAMVPSGESKTYQNVQQDSEAFVRFTLGPWLSRVEGALSGMLPRGQSARFNLDAMLRDDTKPRYEAHAIGLAAGFLTIDEVRELENLEPLPTPDPTPVPEPVEVPDV